MPDINKIKRFDEILKSLGSEMQILADKGEKIEEIPLPEEGLPDDLSALLTTDDSTPGSSDFIDLATSDSSEEELDQLDNIEDFLMPSLGLDDMDPDSEDLGDFGREADELAATGAEGQLPPLDTEADDFLSETTPLPPPDDFTEDLPDDFGLLPPLDTSPEDSGSEFESFPSLDAAESDPGLSGSPGELSGDEFTGDDFLIPEDTTQPAVDAFSTADFTIDDFVLPGDSETGAEATDNGFELPEEGGPPLPDDTSLPDEFSLDQPDTTDTRFEPPVDSSGEEPGADDFTIPEDLVQPPDNDFPLSDEFALPDDLEPPPGDEGLPDEFALPAEDATHSPEDSSLSPDISDMAPEDDFSLDDFAIPDDFEAPVGETERVGRPADSTEDILDDFNLPDDPETGTTPAKAGEAGGEFVIDEFSLPGLDDDLEIDSLDDSFSAETPPTTGEPDKTAGAPGELGGIVLTDKEFANLQATLSMLPRNLKIIVQDLIGLEQLSGEPLEQLLKLLTTSASPQKIADFVTKTTGQKIELPLSFEKKTGVEFARERRSLPYIFRENIVPMLKVFLPALLLLCLIIYLVFRFLVIPYQADQLYKQGLYYIQTEHKFYLGDETFNEAYKINPEKKWFYRYAESYAGQHEYKLAEMKYEQLLNLGWRNSEIAFMTNFDEKGIVDYANLESARLNFSKAEKLLNYFLAEEKFNKAALFATGDNYMAWAKQEPAKYEEARLAYSKLLRTNADRKAIDFRFLRYFIRVDNFEEVNRLKDLYQKNEKIVIDPDVYTELGGYLLDKNEWEEVREILFRAKAVKENIPELHYNLARYFNLQNEQADEQQALFNTLYYLKDYTPLSTEQRELKIDSHNRLGKLYFKQRKIIDAEREYTAAVEMIEQNQQNANLGKKPEFGEVYYNLANLYYYDALDYKTAAALYAKAGENYFQDPDLFYKQGYINYFNQDYLAALLNFYQAENEVGDNINLLYALGNTLYYRNDFFAAQGYYNHLLNILRRKRDAITLLRPEENPEHLQLINYIMRTYNNLAVTLKRLSERPRDPARETEALVYLTKSSEQYDILKRLLLAPETMARDKETRNIAYLNQRQILYPQSGYTLSLYKENPFDIKTMLFKDDWFSLPLY